MYNRASKRRRLSKSGLLVSENRRGFRSYFPYKNGLREGLTTIRVWDQEVGSSNLPAPTKYKLARELVGGFPIKIGV